MISISEVEVIHNILIDKFGGSKGVRDIGALESAIARPFATFGQVELYPTPIDKAAAVLESILINHPFIDGNKRTGYTLMRLILLENGLDIYASQAEKYQIVISTSTGEARFDEIKIWLESRVK